MTTTAAAPPPPIDEATVEGHLPGFGLDTAGRVLFLVAVVFSLFQLWTAAYALLPSQVVRSVHVGFLLLLLFGLAAEGLKGSPGRLIFWVLGLAGFVTSFYHWVFYEDLIVRSGDPSQADIVVGVIVIAIVFVAGWRLMGWALPIMCGITVAYALFGQYLPPPLDHRGFDFAQVVDQLFLGTEGIYGLPVYVSSTYIFLFILFGAFLERAGMIQLFNDIAMGTVGHARGGPAKVAVVSSALMGTINGSGVANVVSTGQFTIPLMKRFGYKPAFAGAVEATASMGGQIMPPVMGAVAFIMAETIDVPYVEIAKAAAIPAILYFFTVFWMVHLEAGKHGLLGLPKDECPSALGAIRKSWYLLLPLVALVWLLFSGYTPLFSGTIGLALTLLIILGVPIAARLSARAFRIAFWVALGLAASAFLQFGIDWLVLVLAVLIVGCVLFAHGRGALRVTIESLADGARNALPVGVACALVGTMIGVFTLTGVATTFARYVVEIGEGSLLLSLLLTMVACIVLGTGLPTIPNYIVTAAIAGPALLELGVPLIVSHMFVFYFGIMADLTPPVALAAFAAAPIAQAPGMTIGWIATRLALAGYVVPFMAVYAPTLMLQPGGPLEDAIGFWPAVVYVVAKAVVAIVLWGAAAVGFLSSRLSWWERLWAFASAGLLVMELPVTDSLGWAGCVAFFAWHAWRSRAVRNAAGDPARL
jgi:TRAP transporter 4TM/12TM fusion protein